MHMRSSPTASCGVNKGSRQGAMAIDVGNARRRVAHHRSGQIEQQRGEVKGGAKGRGAEV